MSKSPYRNPVVWLASAIGVWGFLGNIIVVPALPEMIGPLNATSQNIGLVLSFFTLPGVFLTPILGHIMDRFGYRRVLVISLVSYSITGLLCSFATDLLILLLLRFIQGISAVGLLPLAMIIVGMEYSDSERSHALGVLNGIYNIFAAFLPLLGGVLAEISWQTPFLVYIFALPTAIIAHFVISRRRHNSEKKPEDNAEPENAIPNFGSKSRTSILKQLNYRQILKPSLLGFLSFFLLIGVGNTYVTLYLADILFLSPLLIGLLTSSRQIIAAITSVLFGRLSSRYTPNQLFLFGYFISTSTISGILVLFASPFSILPIVLLGAGHGLIVPLCHACIYERAPGKRRGVIISIYQTMLRLGQTIGPIGFGLFFGFGGLTSVFSAGIVISLIIVFLLIVNESQKHNETILGKTNS